MSKFLSNNDYAIIVNQEVELGNEFTAGENIHVVAARIGDGSKVKIVIFALQQYTHTSTAIVDSSAGLLASVSGYDLSPPIAVNKVYESTETGFTLGRAVSIVPGGALQLLYSAASTDSGGLFHASWIKDFSSL